MVKSAAARIVWRAPEHSATLGNVSAYGSNNAAFTHSISCRSRARRRWMRRLRAGCPAATGDYGRYEGPAGEKPRGDSRMPRAAEARGIQDLPGIRRVLESGDFCGLAGCELSAYGPDHGVA